jgi:hypothetical protein
MKLNKFVLPRYDDGDSEHLPRKTVIRLLQQPNDSDSGDQESHQQIGPSTVSKMDPWSRSTQADVAIELDAASTLASLSQGNQYAADAAEIIQEISYENVQALPQYLNDGQRTGRKDGRAAEGLLALYRHYTDLVSFVEEDRSKPSFRLSDSVFQRDGVPRLQPEQMNWNKDPLMKWAFSETSSDSESVSFLPEDVHVNGADITSPSICYAAKQCRQLSSCSPTLTNFYLSASNTSSNYSIHTVENQDLVCHSSESDILPIKYSNAVSFSPGLDSENSRNTVCQPAHQYGDAVIMSKLQREDAGFETGATVAATCLSNLNVKTEHLVAVGGVYNDHSTSDIAIPAINGIFNECNDSIHTIKKLNVSNDSVDSAENSGSNTVISSVAVLPSTNHPQITDTRKNHPVYSGIILEVDSSGLHSSLPKIAQENTKVLTRTSARAKTRNHSSIEIGNEIITESSKQCSDSLSPIAAQRSQHTSQALEPTILPTPVGNVTPSGLGILCAVVVQLSQRAELRRWTLYGASCAEAVRTAPAEEGAFGRIYRLRDGPSSALALKIFKSIQGQIVRSSAENDSNTCAGLLSDACRLNALVELFHLLRCRDLEQASNMLNMLHFLY